MAIAANSRTKAPVPESTPSYQWWQEELSCISPRQIRSELELRRIKRIKDNVSLCGIHWKRQMRPSLDNVITFSIVERYFLPWEIPILIINPILLVGIKSLMLFINSGSRFLYRSILDLARSAGTWKG